MTKTAELMAAGRDQRSPRPDSAILKDMPYPEVESDYVSDEVNIIWKLSNITHVTIDIGGGAAKNVAPRLLKEIGCQVTTINDELEGCTRGPDPTFENIEELVDKAKNICFAFDLDSDRVILVMNG